MKKLLLIFFLFLFPVKAIGFELIIPMDFNGMLDGHSNPKSIIDVAMKYEGYDENKNRKELRQLLSIDPARTPWCAGFINFVLDKAGYESTGDLQASSYHRYGTKVKDPQPGDIVLLRREGGSGRHVAFFVGYYSYNGVRYIQLLGGNQERSVKISSYPIAMVVEIRRPVKKIG